MFCDVTYFFKLSWQTAFATKIIRTCKKLFCRLYLSEIFATSEWTLNPPIWIVWCILSFAPLVTKVSTLALKPQFSGFCCKVILCRIQCVFYGDFDVRHHYENISECATKKIKMLQQKFQFHYSFCIVISYSLHSPPSSPPSSPLLFHGNIVLLQPHPQLHPLQCHHYNMFSVIPQSDACSALPVLQQKLVLIPWSLQLKMLSNVIQKCVVCKLNENWCLDFSRYMLYSFYTANVLLIYRKRRSLRNTKCSHMFLNFRCGGKFYNYLFLSIFW